MFLPFIIHTLRTIHVLSLGVSLCFKFFFPTLIILFVVFSFSFLCVLLAFICFQFLGFFILIFSFFFFSLFWD